MAEKPRHITHFIAPQPNSTGGQNNIPLAFVSLKHPVGSTGHQPTEHISNAPESGGRVRQTTSVLSDVSCACRRSFMETNGSCVDVNNREGLNLWSCLVSRVPLNPTLELCTVWPVSK